MPCHGCCCAPRPGRPAVPLPASRSYVVPRPMAASPPQPDARLPLTPTRVFEFRIRRLTTSTPLRNKGDVDSALRMVLKPLNHAALELCWFNVGCAAVAGVCGFPENDGGIGGFHLLGVSGREVGVGQAGNQEYR